MSEDILDKAYPSNVNVEIGKFSVVVSDTSVQTNGFALPGGSNAGKLLGVIQESLLPDNVADYSGGVYNIVSGTAWPTNAVPASGLGLGRRVRRIGISRCVAASAINRGDRVNVNDTQGRIKTINETAGTLVHELGIAEEAAVQAGDVIRVMITLIDRHT